MSNPETELDPFEQKTESEPKPKTGNAGTMRTARMAAARDAERLYNLCPDGSPDKIKLLELLEKLTKAPRPPKRVVKSLFGK
jgi:hypothetical protein